MEPLNPAGEEANELAAVVGIEPGWAMSADSNGRRTTWPILRIRVVRHPIGPDADVTEPYTDTLVVHIDDQASYSLAVAMAALHHQPAPPTDQ